MPRRRRDKRVLGPYQHRSRWRVIVVQPGGKKPVRRIRSYATEEAAREVIKKAERILDAEQYTVARAIEEWTTDLQASGVKQVTVDTSAYRLGLFFDDRRRPVADLSSGVVRGMYERLRRRVVHRDIVADTERTTAVQTHRHALAEAKRFLRWCVERGHLRKSPAAGLKPVGKPKRGKPQLRLDEARQLRDVCLTEVAQGDEAALAVLIILLQGLRASEVAGLMVRDIDDGGSLLWVSDAKTEAGRRVLRVYEPLRSILGAYAKDRIGRLFPDRNRWWVGYHTRRLCWLAKVPEVPPHGLRGTHATLGTDEGAAAEAVMRALGHTSTEVGRRHYLTAGATERRQAGRVAAAMAGGERYEEDRSPAGDATSNSAKGGTRTPTDGESAGT